MARFTGFLLKFLPALTLVLGVAILLGGKVHADSSVTCVDGSIINIAQGATQTEASQLCAEHGGLKQGTAGTGGACNKGSFFGLIPWYGYLPTITDDTSGHCDVNLNLSDTSNWVKLWGIALAIFEDLVRIAGMVAVGFVIYGGIRYTTSQGNPETTGAALRTIINALIGAAIAAIAAVTVTFIGSKLGGG